MAVSLRVALIRSSWVAILWYDSSPLLAPLIERTHKYPLTSNDPKLTDELRTLFIKHFGEAHVEEMERVAGSEDFPNLALPHNAPYVYWFWGSTATEKYDKAVENGKPDDLPQVHSAEFAPSIRPTLETGVRALYLAALYYPV